MNAERARTFLLGLPNVVETAQWGGLVFWVGDKAIGGKMFAMMNPEGVVPMQHPMTVPVGAERFAELMEVEGFVPAPYLARLKWVSAERWDAFRDREWEEAFVAAHAITFEKMPPKVKTVLAMSKAAQKRLITERRKVLAEKSKAKAKK
ncbi:MmcQ/YjbR family DNA-binding protein [Granulicella tundricola]|uniref:MmcQ/YjbR family DNA-binding protein n=1 Tax=Granulicella tundricola (strain ATCC BAA-1859 / DSM 23138 / MP5ACTX9) TaxID=1198114 RepID=E8X1R0_GRATM|nr:MmcQ/YjbR family DNA-binding protein [Granulicella tundricola]ADW67979.1 hypothetical protein AciX9_0912 [Granulicella tundricola MP5ACTX9]